MREAATLGPNGCSLSADLPGKVNLGYGDLDHHNIFTEKKNPSFKLCLLCQVTHIWFYFIFLGGGVPGFV